LMFSLLDLGGSLTLPPAQHFVGDPIPLPQGRTVSVLDPDGMPLRIREGQEQYFAVKPGIHQLGTVPPTRLAVNLPSAESLTAPLPEDELERLGAPVARAAPDAARETERRVRLQNAELEARQKLWRWLLVAVLGIVLVETLLAGWSARRAALPQEEPA